MATTHQHVRATRDNLIDLLGFGLTYPLTDLDIRDDQLKVPFETSAKIPVEISQKGVVYQLRDKDGRDLAEGPFEVAGNGEEVLLETPLIRDDKTFKILARKQHHPDRFTAYLDQTAEVKVGLDVTLSAAIFSAKLLEPAVDNPPADAPRIIDYGESVEIRVKKSQEGVDYHLLHIDNSGKEISLLPEGNDSVRGNRGDIVLKTKTLSIHDDLNIHIRATKTFALSANRQDETELLETVLPLKVRADPAPAVSVQPGPIADFNGSVTITVAAPQVGVRYRPYRHRIIDHPRRDRSRSEFVINVQGNPEVADDRLLTVVVPGNPNDPKPVQVRKPAGSGGVWLQTPEDYQEAGDFQPGDDDTLTFPLDQLTDDSLVIFQAQKNHRVGERTISSAVQLDQTLALLVRPDPAVSLTLRIPVEQGAPIGPIQVFNGQPGIFYFFRLAADGDDLEPPVYFHKRSVPANQADIGVGELRLQVDFAAASGESLDVAEFDVLALPADAVFHGRAKKAITGVSTELAHTIPLPPVPAIQPVTEVEAGRTAEITIQDSDPKVHYQLRLADRALAPPVAGNGNSLTLKTEALSEDTELTLRSTHPLDGGLSVELEQKLTITVANGGTNEDDNE